MRSLVASERPLRQQIEEVQRELAMRADVYARQVAARKMRQGEADEHMARMRAVLQTLINLQAAEAELARSKP